MFDVRYIIESLLPPKYRKVKMIAWLHRQLIIFRRIALSFNSLRSETLLYLSYSSQTFSLETLLNTVFPMAGGQIWIENIRQYSDEGFIFFLNENIENGYDYFLSETPPNNEYDYFLSEVIISENYDFIVHIPLFLSSEEERIIAILERMRLASKKYVIQYF